MSKSQPSPVLVIAGSSARVNGSTVEAGEAIGIYHQLLGSY
jgi:hypothetical protein